MNVSVVYKKDNKFMACSTNIYKSSGALSEFIWIKIFSAGPPHRDPSVHSVPQDFILPIVPYLVEATGEGCSEL